MLVAGDERWRTQGGNNNAYVQDNPVSWLDWEPGEAAQDMLDLTRQLLTLRRQHPVLRQPAFFEGRAVEGGDGCKDLAWFHPAGREFTPDDWFDSQLRSIGMYLDGRGLRHRDRRGEVIVDESFLLLLHAGDQSVRWAVPGTPWADNYTVVLDTSRSAGAPAASRVVAGGATVRLTARSVLLLRAERSG
jgi:glycogen operon protein